MTRKPKVLLAASDNDLREVLERLAGDLDDFDFDSAPASAIGQLNGRAVLSAAMIVEIDVARAAAVDEFAALTRAIPGPRIIAAARSAGSDDVRRLFRAGAADVLTAPFTAETVRAALLDAVSAPQGPTSGGSLIAVLKAGGGAGATTVALNLARCLSSSGAKRAVSTSTAAVLDLDLQFGDAATLVSEEPRSTMLDVLRGAERFDARFLEGVMTDHNGVRLLAAAPGMIPLEAMSRELAVSIVAEAARGHDFVVADVPAAWTDWTMAVLERADVLVLVLTPSVSSVVRARRLLDAMKEAGLRAPVFVIANRLQGYLEAADKPPRIERSLDVKVAAKLAFDTAAVRAADRGELVVDAYPNSRIARDLRSAAATLKQRLVEVRTQAASALSGEAA